MKKSIYKITNKVTNKIYIGQSINPMKRWQSHKSHARCGHEIGKNPLYDAMRKYGEENFLFEIIGWYEDYNEKEKYFIKYYNSLIPNGYNIQQGGEEPPHNYGENHYNSSYSQEVVDNIINDLLSHKYTQKEIEQKYNVSLDWYLISATNLYKAESTEETMKANLGGYDRDSVDDINKAQSVPGLPERYQAKAVHGLAVARDTYVANLIKGVTTAGHVTTAAGRTAENIKTAIDAGIVALRERNFDEEGVIEITPDVYNIFKNELITLSTNNPEYIKKGIVGVYDGFDVIMSNNMAKDTTGTTKYSYCDIRGKKAIAFVGQINEVEALRAEKRFKDIVRGLDTFGSKVIDENRIQVVKVPLAD